MVRKRIPKNPYISDAAVNTVAPSHDPNDTKDGSLHKKRKRTELDEYSDSDSNPDMSPTSRKKRKYSYNVVKECMKRYELEQARKMDSGIFDRPVLATGEKRIVSSLPLNGVLQYAHASIRMARLLAAEDNAKIREIRREEAEKYYKRFVDNIEMANVFPSVAESMNLFQENDFDLLNVMSQNKRAESQRKQEELNALLEEEDDASESDNENNTER